MKIYGVPLLMGGGGGKNDTLPPLLYNFTAERVNGTDGTATITLSADRMPESLAGELAGATWVYGEHEPKNINDGTRLELTREEIVKPKEAETDIPPAQKTFAWHINKDLYARQFTYNSKKQYQTMLSGAIAYSPIKPLSIPLSSLPSKSLVKLGNYNGTPLKWIVCRDSVDQSLRLILDGESVSAIGNKMVDNAEPKNSDSIRRSYGNNRYIWSNIRQWLNSAKNAGQWYTAQHSADAPPDYTNVAGFLHEWTEKEIGVLENANWVVTKHSIDGGGTESFQDRIVLPSTTEMGLRSNTGGARIDIFNNNEDRIVTGKPYWCRTPLDSAHVVGFVTTDGTLHNIAASTTERGVRPLCKPLSNTQVTPEPDSDGCYTIV